jgi:hypothetical protein
MYAATFTIVLAISRCSAGESFRNACAADRICRTSGRTVASISASAHGSGGPAGFPRAIVVAAVIETSC